MVFNTLSIGLDSFLGKCEGVKENSTPASPSSILSSLRKTINDLAVNHTRVLSYSNEDDDMSVNSNVYNIFDTTVRTLWGSEYPLSKCAGKKAYLIVNISLFNDSAIAHENYSKLQALYDKYADLEILAFPSRDFSEAKDVSCQAIAKQAKLQ